MCAHEPRGDPSHGGALEHQRRRQARPKGGIDGANKAEHVCRVKAARHQAVVWADVQFERLPAEQLTKAHDNSSRIKHRRNPTHELLDEGCMER